MTFQTVVISTVLPAQSSVCSSSGRKGCYKNINITFAKRTRQHSIKPLFNHGNGSLLHECSICHCQALSQMFGECCIAPHPLSTQYVEVKTGRIKTAKHCFLQKESIFWNGRRNLGYGQTQNCFMRYLKLHSSVAC